MADTPAANRRGPLRAAHPARATTSGDPAVVTPATAWGRLIGAAVLGVAVVAAAVTAVVIATGPDRGTGTAASRPAGSQDQSAGSATPSATTPLEPGAFGRPSLPASNPYDAFQGARAIPGVDLAATRQALTGTWGLEFTSRAMLGGVLWTGLGGDRSRRQRRLDAVYQTTDDGSAVFQVMCQSGGSEVTPTDETSLRFVPDCVTMALHGPDRDTAAGWLTTNLGVLAEHGGSTWVQLPTLRMYVVSNQHVISCVLTNS